MGFQTPQTERIHREGLEPEERPEWLPPIEAPVPERELEPA